MDKETSEAIIREFEERRLRLSPPWWRVPDEEFIKKWRRSPKRRELIESLRHFTEEQGRRLYEGLESLFQPDSRHVFQTLYEGNKLRRTRPHSLSYGHAVAACRDVERRMVDKDEKWSVALEEVAKKYGVSAHTLQRIRRDKRVYESVERHLRIEAGRLAARPRSPKIKS